MTTNSPQQSNQLLVFTDLDGTLLDHDHYSLEPAREALTLLNKHHIPVIFNTSKTRVETIHLRQTLHNSDPFATENGSCLSVPDGYFEKRNQSAPPGPSGDVHTTVFGDRYENIRQALCQIRAEFGFSFTGFGDMTPEQIAECTGLASPDAARAKHRDCSEPLVWEDSDENLELFTRLLETRQLTITRGGRFYHIARAGNKGHAVQWLTDYFQAECPDTRFITVGLGDGKNDLPMLESVDYPILIRPEHGHGPDCQHIKNLVTSEVPGPAGWNQEVIKLIEHLI